MPTRQSAFLNICIYQPALTKALKNAVVHFSCGEHWSSLDGPGTHAGSAVAFSRAVATPRGQTPSQACEWCTRPHLAHAPKAKAQIWSQGKRVPAAGGTPRAGGASHALPRGSILIPARRACRGPRVAAARAGVNSRRRTADFRAGYCAGARARAAVMGALGARNALLCACPRVQGSLIQAIRRQIEHSRHKRRSGEKKTILFNLHYYVCSAPSSAMACSPPPPPMSMFSSAGCAAALPGMWRLGVAGARSVI